MNKKNKLIIMFLIIVICLGVFCHLQNNSITINNIDYTNKKLPDDFNGYKILHISDLHNKRFGKKQDRLVELTNKVLPDIIVITGDLIDSRSPNIDIAMEYIERAINIAPIYYVTGNHERRLNTEYTNLYNRLVEAGVTVLDNNSTNIKKNDAFINISGLDDYGFSFDDYMHGNKYSLLEERLKSLEINNSNFNILLAHRPENIDIYSQYNPDIVFSGHAHGGQFRLPFIGGIAAPGQGFFPKYTSGTYTVNNSTLIVSRGLGNSIFPLRLFNRPEIVVVTLQNE